MTIDRARVEAAAVVALSAGWIVLLWAGFHPLVYGDSGGYVAPGCMLWGPYPVQLYDGARTPLYPLFLSAMQHVSSGRCLLEPEPAALALITGVQLLLYLGAVVYLSRALAASGRVVGLVGTAAIAFSPLYALFTRQVLSEAIAGPLLLVFVAHLVRFASGRSVRDATLAFVALTLLTLARPNVLLPLLPAVALVLWLGADRRRLLLRALLATALPLFLATCLNYANTGYFKLTNFEGFAKTHVVYNVFDRVHAEDAVLGSILAAQHRLDVASGQADGQVVWRAMPRIWEAIDGMPYVKRSPVSAGTSDLNAYLGEVSGYLIRENPGVVVGNARRTFLELWDVGVFAVPPTAGDPRSPGHDGNLRSTEIHELFMESQRVYNALVRLALALVPILLLIALCRRGPRGAALPLVSYAVYLGNMLVVSLLNVVQARYLALMQPFLVLALCTSVACVLEELGSRARRAAPAAP